MPGLDELKKKLQELERKVVHAAEEAVHEATEDIFDVTQERVPRGDTGLLAASGGVEKMETTRTKVGAKIHYGDSDTDRVGVFYAAAVHEILSHEHAAPTGPKYVEGPLVEGIPRIKEKLAVKIGDAVKEGLR